MVQCSAVDSNVNGFSSFSGTLFAVLVYYLEVEDVGSGEFVGNVMFVNCTKDMTIVFFYSIFQTSAGFSYARKVASYLLGRTICRLCFVLVVMEFYL